MPKFTNDSGSDLEFPALGILVAAGDSFEVSEDAAEGLRHQSIFTESKTTKTPKESN